jgi:hypothetical protein
MPSRGAVEIGGIQKKTIKILLEVNLFGGMPDLKLNVILNPCGIIWENEKTIMGLHPTSHV